MLEELKTKHREIARLKFEGVRSADIAKRTGVSLATVYKILRDPICKGYISGLGDKMDETTLSVRERLMKLNDNALECFEDILSKDSKASYTVQAAVSKDVLDRTGNKAPDKIDINHTLENKSDDEIDAQIKALEKQIESIYNSDLTSDEDEEINPEDDILLQEAKINPVTDCKEDN